MNIAQRIFANRLRSYASELSTDLIQFHLADHSVAFGKIQEPPEPKLTETTHLARLDLKPDQ